MLETMLDTSVCVRALRDRSGVLRSHFRSSADRLCISTIALMELLYGANLSSKPDHHKAEVEDFVQRLVLLDFDDEAAAHAADIKTSLKRAGTPIGAHDTLIAGHARSRGLLLLTGNLGEFQRVPGLRCQDWAESKT
ncbi:tRNA(fMet)-specific endonuclease VapC [Brevundimonas vesicularis]|uniref:tRNA(fMet)-specific endonuclease VapC n=1 Tax=Brevundimonas vesicularis TaxID=41276 RepID=UPI0022AC3105|nr:tRNA(fMet)-specific endonuclease VapC [Brevundimonas vesicularis]